MSGASVKTFIYCHRRVLNLMQRIDSHVHLGTWPEFDLSFSVLDLEKVAQKYDYAGVIVMPALTGNPTRSNETMLNTVLTRRQLYANRQKAILDFYPFVWVHPKEPLLLTWLQQRRNRYTGLKFHASISQTSLVDNTMLDVLEFADGERLPLIYHCGRNPISSAAYVKLVAPTYPKIRFVVAHIGGNSYDQILKTMDLFERFVPENVYFDTSTARHPDLLTRAIKAYGPDRILFGTDLPFTDQRLNFDCLRYAGLDCHEGIMGGNLLRLLEAR